MDEWVELPRGGAVTVSWTETASGRWAALIRRGVVTANPADRDECCGLERDEDGFCVYRPRHPIYVEI
jgi:hypothetical protein